MAYEDPNAPSSAPAPTTTPAATPAPATTEKKSGSWDWLWPSILAVIIVKLFGLVGGLVAFGSYYWLKPKLGTWGAVAASGVIGVVVAIGLLAMIRCPLSSVHVRKSVALPPTELPAPAALSSLYRSIVAVPAQQRASHAG